MLPPKLFAGHPASDEEVATAIANARAEFPIDPRGLGPFDSDYPPNQHSFDHPQGREQIATALDWLRAEGFRLKGLGAYALKHLAERWGKAEGRSPYVSVGAMLIALHALGEDVVLYGR